MCCSSRFRDDGYQMINVTYQEDLLIATKVAGNGTIAIGEEMMRVSAITLVSFRR